MLLKYIFATRYFREFVRVAKFAKLRAREKYGFYSRLNVLEARNSNIKFSPPGTWTGEIFILLLYD